MWSLRGKIVFWGVTAVGIYLALMFADFACPEVLTSCQLFEPFSPW